MKYVRPIFMILVAAWGLNVLSLHTSTFGFLYTPMLFEFGWTRAMLSNAFLWAPLMSLPFLLLAGLVYDRRGGRLLVIVGAVLAALAGIGLSRTDSFGLFAVSYCAFTVGGALFGGIIPLLILANWFVRLRGILIGVVIAGASAVILPASPLVALSVDYLGWRTSLLILGLLPLVLIPLALFIKRRPEDDNSSPDFGIVSNSGTLLGQWSTLAARRYHPSYDAQGIRAGLEAYSLSFGKHKTALGTLACFLLLAITVIAFAAKDGMSVHLVPHMIDHGVSTRAAALSLSARGITVSAGALVLGVLSDFIHSRICLAASLVIFGAGILVFVATPHSLVPPLVMGFGQGGLVCLVTVVLADYFGRGALGTLRGIVGMLMAIAGMIGPVFLGYVFDTTADYTIGFVGMGAGVLVCAALALFMRPPPYAELDIGLPLEKGVAPSGPR